MRGQELLDRMELIAPAYVEAADAPMRKPRARLRWAVPAACCALLAAGAVALFAGRPGTESLYTADAADPPTHLGTAEMTAPPQEHITPPEVVTPPENITPQEDIVPPPEDTAPPPEDTAPPQENVVVTVPDGTLSADPPVGRGLPPAVDAAKRADGEETQLTLAEARDDPDFGAYMPDAAPSGFAEESVRRYRGENNDFLSGLWTRGYAELRWQVSYYTERDAARLTGVDEPENYDLARYPIPRADSVPEALREIVNDPIFRAEELTPEAVWARAYRVDEAGDSGGWRMSFSVKYGDRVVRVTAKGVEPDWVYAQLSALN